MTEKLEPKPEIIEALRMRRRAGKMAEAIFAATGVQYNAEQILRMIRHKREEPKEEDMS